MSGHVASTSRRLIRGLALSGLSATDERALVGMVSGVLYLTGALSTVMLEVLPGPALRDGPLAAAIAAVGFLWGLACLLWIRWDRAPRWLTHASTTAGFAVAASVMAATTAADSPARFYLFFIVVFAAYFYARRIAFLYLVGCAITAASPLLYDGAAVNGGFLRELVVVIPSYFALGLSIAAGKSLLTQLRVEAERVSADQRRLADEQGALRRVATAVAGARAVEEIYGLVSREAARLVDGDAAGLLRFESPTQAIVVGSWNRPGGSSYTAGTVVAVRPGSDMETMLRSGITVRVDNHADGSPVRRLGYRCSVVAPVTVGEHVWGLLAIVSAHASGLPVEAEQRMAAFCDLLATSIANTEQRAQLAAQAVSDPLTGLVNHRFFHERLRVEVGRALRHRSPLALAIVDIDHFKEANDSVGHEVGDRILKDLSERLTGVARAEDIVARIGGDEFAIIFPETDRLQALSAVERVRGEVRDDLIEGRHMTISAGICDLRDAADAETLFRLADGALYWSKAHGRDTAWVYDPEVVHQLSAQERADQLQRSQAMTGLRALARAIDARDTTTHRHSERVSLLAAALAEGTGWAADRTALLREAALIHDVGKIGVPDSILFKPGSLTPEEYEQVKQHALLSAQIAAEVLGSEQVSWVRAHHERPDGRGYPAGLRGSDIPEGATLLALADSWDVMTISRPYSLPKSTAEALRECHSLVGAQFTVEAVAVLAQMHASGQLDRLTAAAAP